MTITSMAKQLDVAPMTIYRRCKKRGINIASLRDDVTGELTSEGVAAIASLFDETQDATEVQPCSNSDTQDVITAAVLQARLDGANAVIDQLTSERDELRKQLQTALAALAAEQSDRQAERLLLTAGQQDKPRKGLFSWLRR